MTRVLAIADTHIGKPLYGRSRLDEQTAVLHEITNAALHSHADLIVHAGDIVDSATIRPDALNVVLRWFKELQTVGIPLVLALGNHEGWPYWRSHTEAYRAAFNVQVIDSGCRIEIDGATIACLPWLYPFRLGEAILHESGTHEYAETAAWLLNHVCREPVDILLTHMRFMGSQLSGTERDIPIRNTVPPSSLQDLPFKHLVAGDIHLRQPVGDRGGYIGAPMQLDFGEAGNTTAATLIDLDIDTADTIPLQARRTLLRLDMSLDEAVDNDPTDFIPPADEDHVMVHVHVSTNGEGNGVTDYVRDKYPWAVKVSVESVPGYGLGTTITPTPPTADSETFPVLDRLLSENNEKGVALGPELPL